MIQSDSGADTTPDATRRKLLSLAAAAVAAPLATTLSGLRALADAPPIQAVAFDAFPIFDLRAVFAKAKQLVPDRGDALREVWLQKLFAYTWLRTTARRYVPFDDVIAEALDYAAGAIRINLGANDRDQLIGAFSALPVWPDVVTELRRLRDQGIRLAFLSNMSERMLHANMRHNDIEQFFEMTLSTDRVRAFKPAPEAYALGVRELHLAKHEIAFVAFAAWDAAGAVWFGYPTVWVNRLVQPAETVGTPSVRTGRGLAVVSELVLKQPQ